MEARRARACGIRTADDAGALEQDRAEYILLTKRPFVGHALQTAAGNKAGHEKDEILEVEQTVRVQIGQRFSGNESESERVDVGQVEHFIPIEIKRTCGIPNPERHPCNIQTGTLVLVSRKILSRYHDLAIGNSSDIQTGVGVVERLWYITSIYFDIKVIIFK